MSKAKAIDRKKLIAFVLPIWQNWPNADSVKTEYEESQGECPG